MSQPPGRDAALQQGMQNAERITALEAALASLTAQLDELGTAVEAAQGTIADQAEVLRSVDGLKDTVDELAHRISALFPDGGTGGAFYTPIPAPRFWQLHGQDREQAAGRLRSWVRDVYQPTFGHLAATLPACWEQHTFCLTVLDVASELHAVLYLQATRNQGLLAGQAELLTRLMPALAALMAAEAARCPHAQSRNGHALKATRPGPPGDGTVRVQCQHRDTGVAMAVYVDDLNLRADVPDGATVVRGRWSHLFADTEEELRAFAATIGLKQDWIQHPGQPPAHFDVTARMRRRALAAGAAPVTWRQAGEFFARRAGAGRGAGAAAGRAPVSRARRAPGSRMGRHARWCLPVPPRGGLSPAR